MGFLEAYLLPHPPLAVPSVGGGMEKKIPDTIAAFKEVACEIAAFSPECIIIVTPHAETLSDKFSISRGNRAAGSFSLFGAPDSRLEVLFDETMADEIKKRAAEKGIHIGHYGTDNSVLDHGVMVPLWYINQEYTNYKVVRIAVSGLGAWEHFQLGGAITEAVNALGQKSVLITSGDLSHKLSKSGPYGFDPAGPEFDRQIQDILSQGDFSKLLKMPETFLRKAAECAYKGLVVMAGCFEGKKVYTEVLSYEAPFGVGYAVARVSESGGLVAKQRTANAKKPPANPYVDLARKALEYAVRTCRELPVPKGLPAEMLGERAGVFVSLHTFGELRGCIGTIEPTTNSIAEEIIRNALNAGLYDPRFKAVAQEELPHLSVKVDVLMKPEIIYDESVLDVKRYGVIVTSGARRGLLLPNLDGINTVEMQVSIAKQKAGIYDGEKIQLERFEVIRHE